MEKRESFHLWSGEEAMVYYEDRKIIIRDMVQSIKEIWPDISMYIRIPGGELLRIRGILKLFILVCW